MFRYFSEWYLYFGVIVNVLKRQKVFHKLFNTTKKSRFLLLFFFFLIFLFSLFSSMPYVTFPPLFGDVSPTL